MWIDQDLCTGDGLCTDHSAEMFVILEDGIAYVRDGMEIGNDPGGARSMVPVAPIYQNQVVAAAEQCPGECIFIEVDETDLR